MSNVSFGTNVSVQKKRVKFINTNSSAEVILYEGMPFCYQFDTTTNILGYDKENAVAGATTAEGYLNEGKFLIVDLPDDDNIHAFAGVLASGSYAGQAVADDGEIWIDIYEPNGAIVPVRADQNCTVGRTVLCIHNAEQHLTGPYSSAARPVAIAWETNSDIDGDAGLILAKLDPNLFLWQVGDGNRLLIDDQDDAQDFIVNRINVESVQTSGRFTALDITAKVSGGGGCHAWGYGIGLQVEATVDATIASHCVGTGLWLNFTDGTPSENITACQIGLMSSGDVTMTSAGRTSALTLTLQITNDVTANSLGWLFLEQNGTQQPDDLILGSNLASLPAVIMTTADRAIGTNNGDYAIKVYLANQAGTQQWYIPLMSSL